MKYELQTTDGRARRGRLIFDRGVVETPAFMPVGTYGTVKGMTPEEVKETGAQILLGNTFHLWLRPPGDHETARRSARLHAVAWADPHRLRRFPGIQPGAMRKIKEEGVYFRNPINGDKVFLSRKNRWKSSMTWVPTS